MIIGRCQDRAAGLASGNAGTAIGNTELSDRGAIKLAGLHDAFVALECDERTLGKSADAAIDDAEVIATRG
jgi:hypothetical protein